MSFDRMQFDSSLYVLLGPCPIGEEPYLAPRKSDRRALRVLLGMEGVRRHRKHPKLDPAGWPGHRDEPSTRAYNPEAGLGS